MNNIPINQRPNPSDAHRHEILQNSLAEAGRPEDLQYIIKLLSPPPDITNYASYETLRPYKIGIIGGGVAGLSAAYELRKLGANITILEAEKERVGGRIYTHYFDEDKKIYGEFGAERIPVSHETTWHYINLFGLETQAMTPPRRNNITYVHNTRLRPSDSIEELLYPKYDLTEEENAMPWEELSEYAFANVLLKLSPEIRAELLMILPQYSPVIQDIINMSTRDGMELSGLSQGAINLISGANSVTGATLETSYVNSLQTEYSYDFRNLYQIKGGNVNLALAFCDTFSDEKCSCYKVTKDYLGTVDLRMGCCVNGIGKTLNDKVIIRYEEDGIYRHEEFDYVLCAIPFSALRTVEITPFFSNMKMQAILELNYANALKTLFWCKRRFWEEHTYYGNILGGVSFTDLPIQSILYPVDHNMCLERGTCAPEEPGVLVAAYNLNQNATRVGGLDEKRRDKLILNNVEEVHGLPKGYLDDIVNEIKIVQWSTEPNYRGAFASDLPGQNSLFLFQMLQPEYNGRVFFAGEHLSSKQAWIQGALQSGMIAANQLVYNILNCK